METHKTHHPPDLLLRIFRWLCRTEYAEDLEGDLQEKYHLRYEKSGKWSAIKGLISDIISLLRPSIIRRSLPPSSPKARLVYMIILHLVLVLLILSPFLPGPPNWFVIGASMLGQVAGLAGIILIPAGIAWIIADVRRNKKRLLSNTLQVLFACLATFVCSVILLVLLIGVFAQTGISTGLLVSMPVAFIISLFVRQVMRLRKNSKYGFHPMSFLLVTIPVISWIVTIYVIPPLSRYSRETAIQKGQLMINAIEENYKRTGRYPSSLKEIETLTEKKLTRSSIMGIIDYRYNQIGERYSLSFSQWLEFGSLEEIVLYDKDQLRDNLQGNYRAYDYGFDLCRIKGAFAVYDTQYPNWSAYHID